MNVFRDAFHNCMHNWLDYDMGLIDEKDIPECSLDCLYLDEEYCGYFNDCIENIKNKHRKNRENKANNKLK